MRYLAVGILLAICTAVADPLAQPQTQKPTFEVASVKKRLEPPPPSRMPRPQGGVFRRVNTTVATLIQYAYAVRDLQLVGGPDWIRKDHFDVEAKAAGEVPTAQMRLMVQSLLEERFGLTVHTEQREMKYFALVVARSDGRLGPYLHSMEEPCDYTKFLEAEKSRPKPVSHAEWGISCGSSSTFEDGASRHVELPVFDRTGLMGKWSFTVYFAPDPGLGPIRLAAEPDPSLPSFRVALQEQLGLKLEETRGPIEMLVIDSVHQPTEN